MPKSIPEIGGRGIKALCSNEGLSLPSDGAQIQVQKSTTNFMGFVTPRGTTSSKQIFFLKLQMKDVKTGSLGGKSKLLRLWCQGQSSSPKMRMTEHAGFLGLVQSWI